MKKFRYFILIILCGFFLFGCGTNEIACSLALASDKYSIRYNVRFIGNTSEYEDYKIVLELDDVVLDEEINDIKTYDGHFDGLEVSTEYKISVYLKESSKDNYTKLVQSRKYSTLMHEFEGIVFEDAVFTYDGTEKFIEVQNLPQGASVTYTGNNQINAGEYTVTATISMQGYQTLELTAYYVIEQAWINIGLKEKVVTYDGEAHTIELDTDIPYTLSWYKEEEKLNTLPVDAGYYYFIYELVENGNYRYYGTSARLIIQKATYDMSEIIVEDMEIVYDGEEHAYEIDETFLPEGVTVSYKYYQDGVVLDGKPREKGTYQVKLTFSGDSANYESIEPQNTTLKII